jgi:hypothetical protein
MRTPARWSGLARYEFTPDMLEQILIARKSSSWRNLR